MVKKLALETYHRDQYLLLRTVTPAVRWSVVITVVEDELGGVTTLSLYQQESEDIRPAAEILKKGASQNDHPSDLIWLDKDHLKVPQSWELASVKRRKSTEQLINRGNKPFKEKEYNAALQKFKKCHTVLEVLTSKFPTSITGKLELERVNASLGEETIGFYDFKDMHRQAKKRLLINATNFIGPLEVRKTRSKGKGLFTTKAVRPAQDLPKNTELGFWYMDPKEGKRDRTPHRERMLQQWGVNCSCTLCDTEQKTPVSKKIKRIQVLNKLSKQGVASPELLTKLEKTYIKPPTEVPQLDAFHSWHSLALTGYERNHTMDYDNETFTTARCILRALTAIGFQFSGVNLLNGKPTSDHFAVEKWGIPLRENQPAFQTLHFAWKDEKFEGKEQVLEDVKEVWKLVYKMAIAGVDETFEEHTGSLEELLEGLRVSS
ncbi:hypothetical protein B0J14DRAFT_671138 [Halenospora varia]|nr:hypothetical protein B0J14DRAFT_671138 [Halenospora varia]